MKRLVNFVVFNGPLDLKAYNGFVNKIDVAAGHVLINSAKMVPVAVEMYIENGCLVIGEDNIPVQSGKIVQFR